MKTNRVPQALLPSTLALIAVTIATFAFAATAVGDDGIAASPKVRLMLNERQAATTPTVVIAPVMVCPKCADVQTTEVNRQAKGAEILAGTATKVITRHACAGCEVNLSVAGEGKARHTVATHKCTADVPNSLACCASN
jgi:hypothetical protein